MMSPTAPGLSSGNIEGLRLAREKTWWWENHGLVQARVGITRCSAGGRKSQIGFLRRDTFDWDQPAFEGGAEPLQEYWQLNILGISFERNHAQEKTTPRQDGGTLQRYSWTIWWYGGRKSTSSGKGGRVVGKARGSYWTQPTTQSTSVTTPKSRRGIAEGARGNEQRSGWPAKGAFLISQKGTSGGREERKQLSIPQPGPSSALQDCPPLERSRPFAANGSKKSGGERPPSRFGIDVSRGCSSQIMATPVKAV